MELESNWSESSWLHSFINQNPSSAAGRSFDGILLLVLPSNQFSYSLHRA